MPEQHTLTHSPERPDNELKRLRDRVAEQAAIIEGQTATIEQMPERIQEFEARPAKDRHNSSPPPASDSPFTKPPPCSRYQPSGRKPGGQPGRRGVPRFLVDVPDQCVIIPLTGTCAGGRGAPRSPLRCSQSDARRQVVAVVIQCEIIEYRIVSGTCACRHAQRSTFPAGIEASVPYGPSVSALAVYMTQYQLLPYQRTAEVLNELAGLGVSPGTLSSAPYGWPPPVWRRQSPRFATHLSRRQWPMPMKPACAGTVTCTGCLCSAPTGLRPTSLSPNAGPRPWMGSAC